jgi:hypothetical protein
LEILIQEQSMDSSVLFMYIYIYSFLFLTVHTIKYNDEREKYGQFCTFYAYMYMYPFILNSHVNIHTGVPHN